MFKSLILWLLIGVAIYGSILYFGHRYCFRPNAYFDLNNKYYVTWDAEGDYLIWETKPVFRDGIWMPKDPFNFNCYPITEDVAKLIIEQPWTGLIKSTN